ncbi:MAG: hypothetical protein ACYTG1_04515 [Planctomycetota bacterium]|jgi:hypothetical protein
MTRDPRLPLLSVLLAALGLAPVAAVARETPQDPPAPPAEPAPPEDTDDADATPDEAEPPPSLDELLGLDEEPDTSAEDAAERDSAAELQRRLDEASITDTFALAVEKMSLSADLLDVRFDTGIGTQRVQEEILQRLEHLIEQARQMSSSSQSSSGSSQGSSQDAAQSDPGQQSRPQGGDPQQRSDAGDSQEGDPPPRQEGDLNTMLEESQTEWGGLPERIRQMMEQGRREKYSQIYRRLTAEYYRRLAEEGST